MSASVIASALAPLLAAVNLSISSTNEYVYVLPLAGDSLTGTGTSASSGDSKLSYTDRAFLTEAFMERSYFLTASATGASSRVEVGLDVKPPQAWDWIKADRYLDPSLTPVEKITKCSRLDDMGISGWDGKAWKDVFSSDNVYVSSTNAFDNFKNGGSLLAASVSDAYSFVGDLTRPCFVWSYPYSNGNDGYIRHITYKDEYSRDHPTSGNYDVSTNYTANANGRLFYELSLTASRWKTQIFFYDGSGENARVAECYDGESCSRDLSVVHTPGNAFFFLNGRDSHGPLAMTLIPRPEGRKAVGVKVFAVGYFSSSGDGFAKTSGYFVVPVSAGLLSKTETSAVQISMDENAVTALATDARALFGAPVIETGKQLLASVSEPAAPSTSGPYDDLEDASDGYSDVLQAAIAADDTLAMAGVYKRVNVSSKTLEVKMYVESFIIYLDMEFNARVMGDGE